MSAVDAAPRLHFAAGEVVCREGEAATGAFLIESGRVEVAMERSDRQVVLCVRGPGEMLGEMALIDGRPRMATVTALEPTTVAHLSQDDVDALLREADPFLTSLMTAMLGRFRETLDKLKQDEALIKSQSLELEAALAQERRLSQLQRGFVSMASHEFRTPLAIISGVLQRITRKADALEGEDLRGYCAKIGGAVSRMLGLIESSLSAARLEAGTLTIETAPCDVGEILRECCQRQREISASHDIALELDGFPDTLTADSAAMDQVFTNLLSNAVKYSAEADRVEVRAWRDGETAFVSVRDFGLGMDAEDLERIGERFFRAKTSVGVAGTGIGLNLVKAILEAHGGALRVTSTPGAGSVFTASLPVAPAAPERRPVLDAAFDVGL